MFGAYIPINYYQKIHQIEAVVIIAVSRDHSITGIVPLLPPLIITNQNLITAQFLINSLTASYVFLFLFRSNNLIKQRGFVCTIKLTFIFTK